MSPIGRRPMAAGSSKIGRQPWTGTMSQHARDDYEDDDEMISLSHTQTNKRQLIGGCSSTQTKNRSTTMSINRHEQQQQQQTPTRQSTRTNHNHHLHRHNSSRRTDARASIVSLWIIVALAFVSMDNVLAGDVKTTSPMTNNTLATNNTTSPAGQMRRTKSLAAGSGPQTDPLVNSKTAASSQQQLSNGFDQQSSELSSMYVQIPIAEPIEASASSTSSDSTSHYTSQQQATDEGDAPADSTKATTWTGPWPKKFQIGYIKQSDLHQVLMESLKGDPFLGSKKSAQNSAGQSSSSSSSSAQVGTKNSLAAPTQVPSLATKSAAGGLPAQMTTQEPGAPTKTASSGGDSLETLPQAPPSDASSLMQPGPYPKLNAVQQVSMSTGRLQQQHHNHQHQQSPLSSTRQYLQSQWPAVNSYGRLASPQVQPRPSAMGYMGKAGPMRQPAGMSHHNQHANQHQLPLLQQQHQQRNHHQSLAAGHHGQHQHHNQPNNFRHQHHARHANQQLHHHQQQQQQQAPFASLPIQVGGHQQQQQLGQNFKYGSIPMQQHQIQPGTFHQQVPSVASPSMGLLQGQQQLQFASGPSLTSQPMYSINSFPASQQQQQQTVMDGDQMELIQLTNGPAKQKSKSEYYLSSWRPVQTTSDDAKQQQQQQQIPASELGTDGFDEDFGSSAAPGSSSQNSMNRHPVLSNFLQSTSGGNGGQLADTTSAKTSPAKTLKQQQRQGTKSSTTTTSNASRQDSKGGSAPFAANKPVADTPAGQKGFDADSVQQRQEGTKSDTGRRALANGASGGDNNSTSGSMITTSMTGDSSTTTMPTTTTTTAATTTTGSSNGISAESGSSTTQATPTTTTTTTLSSAPGVNQTTTTMSSVQGAETTTEPDSEVFETDNTEAPGLDGGDEPTTTSSPVMPTTATSTTTTSSSMMPVSGSRSTSVAPTLQSPSSSTQSSVQQQQSTSADGGESEVVTQGNQQSVSSGTFPAVPQSLDESTTSSAGGQLGGGQSTTSSSSREETTPSSNGVSLGGGGAEVEGSSGGTSSTTTTQSTSSEATKTDASMSDEALMAAAVRANDQVTKSRAASRNSQRQSQQRQQKTNGQSTSGTKKARSSERIVQTGQQSAASGTKTVQRSQQQQQQQQTGNNKLITRKPNSQRAGKQISPTKGQTASISAGASKVASSSLVRDGKSAAQKSGQSASSTTGSATKTKKSTSKSAKLASVSAAAPKSSKFTRMAASSPNGSGQQTGVGQMVSMTAAQAQSAAQTLASLLLSRCLSSSNCSNLLDVCSTKQAAVPFGSSATNQQTTTTSTTTTTTSATTSDTAAAPINASIAAAWSMPVGLVSSNLMGLMQALQADKALQLFPAWREAIENVMDQEAPAGYTLVMPSNDAVDRMPLVQVDALLANSDQMNQLIDNHIIDSAEIIELGPGRGSSSSTSLATLRQRHQTRYIKSKGLQINQHRDRMVTINGKRVVYANQQAPGAGRIHVIDGLLDSPGQPLGQASSVASAPTGANNKLPDIMDTLRQCDKFDGFVTLAEGTGLAQILKQDEPLTVFVPSNEALRKIPDEELEVIKNNSTALREFIMYHIVNGSYFSQDLRDGQQLPSILDMRPIQVGVRVDGCSRRLVEANTSPMRRPDIVAKNGVIHILDWYLTTRDNEWCDPIGRSAANSDSSRGSSSQRDSFAASERVQQLASEQVVASISGPALSPSSTSTINLTGSSGNNNGYATRMTNLPANHKPAAAAPATNDMDTAASNNNLIEPTKLTSLISGQPTLLNSVYVSAMPMSSVTIETVQ